VAKTVHVDAMLAGMTPQEFDEWMTAHWLEPWGDDWLQASVIATAIINEIRRQLCKDIKDDDLVKLDALVPKPPEDEPETSEYKSLRPTMRALAGV
jgi:hypothetical protein